MHKTLTLVIRSAFCLHIFVKSVLAGGLFTVTHIVSLNFYWTLMKAGVSNSVAQGQKESNTSWKCPFIIASVNRATSQRSKIQNYWRMSFTWWANYYEIIRAVSHEDSQRSSIHFNFCFQDLHHESRAQVRRCGACWRRQRVHHVETIKST